MRSLSKGGLKYGHLVTLRLLASVTADVRCRRTPGAHAFRYHLTHCGVASLVQEWKAQPAVQQAAWRSMMVGPSATVSVVVDGATHTAESLTARLEGLEK